MPTAEENADDSAAAVVDFWRAAGRHAWFRKDDVFDRKFRARFLQAHERAARGDFDDWVANADGALALMILLDQFPRNAFRDTPRSFATDGKARQLAHRIVEAGVDREVPAELRSFIYLPFEHSEDPADQQRSLALMRPLGGEALQYAQVHADVIRRFGRFPHRNRILGRESTPEEMQFLASGGFSG